ncbi:MerR family transcriptional regulator [Nocardioides marmoriginsengisoli]|uniref:MerR family transcriptional regulator n=1 Tax=Nocardioides marmoriginsengisoli TaxID=661483 RepID=A0A3N0CPE4_9ACTN|nr:MerR family transcriptional regulator [Nocardioides marmoriginsengisoli]RNL65171.1 MerR family transcriptional regulator [Nocardioides marmoriginsengisoli]
MWMAELASRSGLSVATVKYYLREGLLPSGTATGATRAAYDETHVRRLRLIRALTDVAGLRLESVRQVLDGIEAADSWHDAVGAAHTRLGTAESTPPTPGSLARVDDMLEAQGWQLAPGHPQAAALAHALDVLDDVGHPISDEMLFLYAHALRPIVMREVASVHLDERGELIDADVEAAVIGTVLQEPVLLSIRRIAQENVSRKLTEGT